MIFTYYYMIQHTFLMEAVLSTGRSKEEERSCSGLQLNSWPFWQRERERERERESKGQRTEGAELNSKVWRCQKVWVWGYGGEERWLDVLLVWEDVVIRSSSLSQRVINIKITCTPSFQAMKSNNHLEMVIIFEHSPRWTVVVIFPPSPHLLLSPRPPKRETPTS